MEQEDLSGFNQPESEKRARFAPGDIIALRIKMFGGRSTQYYHVDFVMPEYLDGQYELTKLIIDSETNQLIPAKDGYPTRLSIVDVDRLAELVHNREFPTLN